MILDVQDLKTYYSTLRGSVKAVDGVNLQVDRGEALGLAGESGCGKTTVALSILRILPKGGRIAGGRILFKGEDLAKLREKEMRKVRWKRASIVFQGAMNALNPLFKVGDQIAETILTHESGVNKKEALKRTENLMETVGLEPSRAKDYPHELSGGMRQRGLIAMALACNPELLIADEPGTALDVIVQAQVLKLLSGLKDRLNLAMIMITHDLSMITETCEKVAIMYAGKIVEQGDIVSVFKKPLHPYTHGLVTAFPHIKAAKRRMTSIPGFPPDLLDPPTGCRFHPRCPYAEDICKRKEPRSMKVAAANQYVACHLVESGKMEALL
ncbi:MAG: ABC transporter ATP-binding protein [Candidatus Bathyarchaeota archaeon]|jgi:peptide/nickel transport system ATP-binding protein